VAEVFSQVSQHIHLRETDYFGLAVVQGNESRCEIQSDVVFCRWLSHLVN